jgi:hypothetical protein
MARLEDKNKGLPEAIAMPQAVSIHMRDAVPPSHGTGNQVENRELGPAGKKGTCHPDNVIGCLCPGKLKDLPPCKLGMFCCLFCYIACHGPDDRQAQGC